MKRRRWWSVQWLWVLRTKKRGKLKINPQIKSWRMIHNHRLLWLKKKFKKLNSHRKRHLEIKKKNIYHLRKKRSFHHQNKLRNWRWGMTCHQCRWRELEEVLISILIYYRTNRRWEGRKQNTTGMKILLRRSKRKRVVRV